MMEIVLVKLVLALVAAVVKVRSTAPAPPSLVLETERYLWGVARHEADLRARGRRG